MFCPVCGSEVNDGAQFCGACGSPINQHEDARAKAREEDAHAVAAAIGRQFDLRDEKKNLSALKSEFRALRFGIIACAVLGFIAANILSAFITGSTSNPESAAGAASFMSFFGFCWPFGTYWLVTKVTGRYSFSLSVALVYLFFGGVLFAVSMVIGPLAAILLVLKFVKYRKTIRDKRSYVNSLAEQA